MIWIILLSTLVLRLISLNQSLWLDEAINTLAVKHYGFYDLITQYARADFHPPGWFILLWFWTKLFGYSEIAIRIPSVIFGMLSVWVIYLIGKKIHSEKLGLVAALLLCVNPLHIYYSQEGRMYMMATLAVSINVFILLKLIKGERTNFLMLLFSNVFVMSSDYLAYLIFPAQLVLILLFKKSLVKQWAIAIGGAILIGIWWLPVFLGQFNIGSLVSSQLPTWKLVVGGFDYKTLPLTFVKFIIGRISLSNKFFYVGILVPICSFFGYAIWRGIKSVDYLSKYYLLLWLIVPPILATMISIFIPVYNYFRVLFVIPAFVILISLGIYSFQKKVQYTVLIIAVVIEIFSSFVYLLDPSFHREDWRGLVQSFHNLPKDSLILFESSGNLPPFDYYAQGKLPAAGALKDFPAKDENDLVNLQDLLKEVRNVYLVNYLIDISDPQRLVDSKLRNLGYRQIEINNFNGVGFVFHYRKNG